MPPDGYETVTVSKDVANRLDELVERGQARSRSDAVRKLVYDGDFDVDGTTVAQRVQHIEETVEQIPQDTAEIMERRFR